MTLRTHGSLLNPILNPNAGIQQLEGGGSEIGGFDFPFTLLTAGVPIIIPQSSSVGVNGNLVLGSQPTAATATFGATSGSTTITLSVATLLGTSSDNGRVFTLDGGKQFTITAFSTSTQATGTISGGVLSGLGPFATWQLAWPLPAFVATPLATYQYFPAGAVFAGSAAGLYFVNMSTPTLGTVFNNVYSGRGPARIPDTLVPIVAAGPGAFTQTTGTPITVSSEILPGKMLGPFGQLRCESYLAANLFGAASRFFQVTMNGQGAGTGVLLPAGAAGFARQDQSIQNMGREDRQVCHHPALTPAFAGTVNVGPTFSIPTDVDTLIANQLQLNNATDFMMQYWMRFTIYPGA